jgi:hypothetical protein
MTVGDDLVGGLQLELVVGNQVCMDTVRLPLYALCTTRAPHLPATGCSASTSGCWTRHGQQYKIRCGEIRKNAGDIINPEAGTAHGRRTQPLQVIG